MKKLLLVTAAMVSTISATEAFANCSPGFLADLACQAGIIDQQTANGLDQFHAGMGRPIETQIVPAIADAWLPGAGVALTTWDQRNRNGGFNGGSMQQQRMGNFCMTQAGRFGPGPVNPIGAPCQAFTPWGVQIGQVSF